MTLAVARRNRPAGPMTPGNTGAGHISGGLRQRRNAARRPLSAALLLAGGAALLTASCTRQPEAVAPATVPPPVLPPAMVPLPVEPPPGGPVNSGLERLEAAWHLRSALNVAALSCGRQANSAVVVNYNQFLRVQKAGLAQAFAAEQARYGPNARTVDTHMTRVYNYFAWPPAQAAFCTLSEEVALHMAAISPDLFLDAAPVALARLDTAFGRFAAAPPTPAPTPAPISPVTSATMLQAAPARPGNVAGWRVQLGSFSDQARAQAAWRQVSGHLPDIARLGPLYQKVAAPAPLVRLLGEQHMDRPEAQRLCAMAATSGFACLPVMSN